MRAVSFRLPDELIARVDEARGLVPRTRWVQRALEQELARTSKAHPLNVPGSGPTGFVPEGGTLPTSGTRLYEKPFKPLPKKGA